MIATSSPSHSMVVANRVGWALAFLVVALVVAAIAVATSFFVAGGVTADERPVTAPAKLSHGSHRM